MPSGKCHVRWTHCTLPYWAAQRLSAMTLFQALLPLPSLKEKHVPSTRVTRTCFTAAVLEGRAVLWGPAMVTASEGLFFYWGHSGSGLKMSVCDSTVGNRHCHMFFVFFLADVLMHFMLSWAYSASLQGHDCCCLSLASLSSHLHQQTPVQTALLISDRC